MQRSTAAIALAASVALVLAGCGRGEEDPGTDGAPQTGEAIATENVKGEIEVWAMGAEGEKLPELAKEFEAAHDGVTVKVTAVPWDSAHEKFVNSITAGTTPDVAMVGTTWMGEFAGLDALDPTPATIDKGAFFEGPWQTTEVGGTSYGVPWYVETRLVYYRTDIAQQAGYEEVPTDWEGFKAMAKAMQDKGGADWGLALQPGGTGSWQVVLPLMWTAGGEVATEDAYTFDTPEMTDALTYFQGFFTDKIANPAPPEGQTEADFTSGKVPMFISGPWMMAIVEDMGGEGFAEKYDVAPIPVPEGGSTSSFVGGSNLAVFKGTDNRDTAWAFVEWLSEPEVQVKWYKLSTDLPSTTAAWEDPALADDEKLAKFGTQLETAKAPPSFPSWEQVAGVFDGEVEKVAKSGADPAESLKTVQQQADSIGTGS